MQFPSKTLEGGYNTRAFNTLMWFIPTPSTTHAIVPVSWWAESRLFYIASIYESDNEEFEDLIRDADRLEEEFGKEENFSKLTQYQAKYIVHEMNPRDMTDDAMKRKKLFQLQQNVATKYLYPVGNTLVLESE